MIATDSFRLESYDLENADDVKRLAEQIGEAWTEAIVRIAANTKEEHRGLFWGHMLAGPFGAMGRSIGAENAEAVTDLLLRVVKSLQGDRKRAAN